MDITEKDGVLTFRFTAEHSSFYCPYDYYNGLHSQGDACEVLIGSDPERKSYYEIEISADGKLMLALMTNHGMDAQGTPILDVGFVEDCFMQSSVEKHKDGYIATVSFAKKDIMSGDGAVYFNAYRLETDGGETDKHLFALYPTMRPKFHAPSYFAYIDEVLQAE